ncbi:hypothetical protein [Melissospora conviva]|uniref:hypothetical protein n=1 Tax=Melissospora conviva TaxID=3388432 RepID=UPI003C1DB0D0
MTERYPELDEPLEELPEVAAAVEDDTAVPQFLADDGIDLDAEGPDFVAPQDLPPGEDLGDDDIIGDAYGRPGTETLGRTGAEQPWEPGDLVRARGEDLTPDNLARARRDLDQDGPAAVEGTVP